jgi:hypothetical protein
MVLSEASINLLSPEKMVNAAWKTPLPPPPPLASSLLPPPNQVHSNSCRLENLLNYFRNFTGILLSTCRSVGAQNSNC